MTKEEIANKHFWASKEDGYSPYQASLLAMDEFAQQQSIAFGKFLSSHEWKPYSENGWENSEGETASTETIYEDFIKNKL